MTETILENVRNAMQATDSPAMDRQSGASAATLADMHAAIEILLDKRETDKQAMEERINATYDTVVRPFIKKLRASLDTEHQLTLLDLLEKNLDDMIRPFSTNKPPLAMLTPAENQVAAMVRQGLSNKEMAAIMNKSVRTISNHRDHIRHKLGLRNRKVNLRSFLCSL